MSDFPAWRRAALQRLESLQRAGVELAPQVASPASPTTPAASPTDPPAAQPRATAPPEATTAQGAAAPGRDEAVDGGRPAPQAPTDPAEARRALAAVAAEAAQCRACPELCDTRTQTVFGVGNPSPRLCFFGEAPGADEDRKGEPFVGAAGQLLDKIIQAMTLRREDVYILNSIKCRPPGNRNPKESEIANCRGFFLRQLKILQPEFICCLGAVAAHTLLENDQPVGRLRGRLHRWGDAHVVVTYHPAYLLRTPAAKRKTWEDMKMLMGEMGLASGP